MKLRARGLGAALSVSLLIVPFAGEGQQRAMPGAISFDRVNGRVEEAFGDNL